MAAKKSTKVILTDKHLENLKPKAQAYELSDAGAKGLRVRVTPTGRLQFRWIYREEGRQRVASLGEYPNTTLAEARLNLEVQKAKHATGRQRRVDVATVKALAGEFHTEVLTKRKDGGNEALRAMNRYVIPEIGTLKPQDVDQADISDLILKASKKAPVYAGKVLQLVRLMFAFALSRGYVAQNPALAVEPRFHGVRTFTPGKRYLSGDEIRAFYDALAASPRMSEPVKIAFKLLLLTGARTGELVKAQWKHVDFKQGLWTIPPQNQKLRPEQAKKADDFLIPLPAPAVALFKELKARAGESAFVMANPDAESGRVDDKTLGHALRRMLNRTVNGKPFIDVEPFTPHDLRRTCRTHLTDTLNVAPHVAEKCLNHSLGQLEKVYDRGELLTQRKKALKRWADWIARVASAKSNVRELHHG